ncbi:peptidoglycan-binding protein [Rhodopseudomonas parapalustris]
MSPNDGLWLEHSPQQIDAVVDLCRALVAAYPTITEIVTHWMIAPARKVDTNPLFPLAYVRKAVFGVSAPKVAAFADVGEIELGEVTGISVAIEPAKDNPDTAAFPDLAQPGEDDGNAGDRAHPADAAEPSEPHPLPKALVEFVQQRLRALGYYEVGNIDGDFFDRTEDALVTFKRHNGLPPTPEVDDATLRALADASLREIGDARARATPKDVSKIVPAVRQAGRSKLLAWLLGAPSAAVAVLQGVAANVSSVMSELSPIMGWLQAVPGWVWALLIVGIAAGIWWSARKAEADTVDAYRAGRLT